MYQAEAKCTEHLLLATYTLFYTLLRKTMLYNLIPDAVCSIKSLICYSSVDLYFALKKNYDQHPRSMNPTTNWIGPGIGFIDLEFVWFLDYEKRLLHTLWYIFLTKAKCTFTLCVRFLLQTLLQTFITHYPKNERELVIWLLPLGNCLILHLISSCILRKHTHLTLISLLVVTTKNAYASSVYSMREIDVQMWEKKKNEKEEDREMIQSKQHDMYTCQRRLL